MRLFRVVTAIVFFVFQAMSYAASNEKIDQLAHEFMKNSNVAGMSIAVIRKDKISIFNYGYANELKKIPTTDNTIYTIASLSKTFTATLAAIASVEGKLNLNASFNQYLPALKNNLNLSKINLVMLLAHVSSLPFNFEPAPATYAQALTDFNQFVPSYPPGSQFRYSNAGIGIVGYAIQNVYNKNYDEILSDKITKPLAMQSTYLNVPPNKQSFVALGHDDDGVRPYDSSIDVWFAAASLKSTIIDLANYLNAQINFTSLNNKTLAQAVMMVHQNYYCFANQKDCEQLAWQAHVMSELNDAEDDTFYSVDNRGNLAFGAQPIINHSHFPKKYFIDKTGSGYGMSSYIAYIPDEKLGVVILLNRSFLKNKAMGNQRIKLGRDILKWLRET